MHDPVPVAASVRVDPLTDQVRIFEKIVIQPRGGHTGLSHFRIDDILSFEGGRNRQRIQR
ncbi:MAG TPA: hypothetical protein DHW45_20415 [Candidatus Latescibacteria bacterium]|nr:hypothetical protein [Candidatus Latescibacterota bacterium]